MFWTKSGCSIYSSQDYLHHAMSFNRQEGTLKQYVNGEYVSLGWVINRSNSDTYFTTLGLVDGQVGFKGKIDEFRNLGNLGNSVNLESLEN